MTSLAVHDAEGAILLVDDDELIAGSLRSYLLQRGIDCDLAGHVQLATAYMQSRRYAVVVVDPYLTGGAGRGAEALLTRIRSLQPDAAILVATAYASAGLARHGRVIEKPQPVPTLTQLILAASARREPSTQTEREIEVHA